MDIEIRSMHWLGEGRGGEGDGFTCALFARFLRHTRAVNVTLALAIISMLSKRKRHTAMIVCTSTDIEKYNHTKKTLLIWGDSITSTSSSLRYQMIVVPFISYKIRGHSKT